HAPVPGQLDRARPSREPLDPGGRMEADFEGRREPEREAAAGENLQRIARPGARGATFAIVIQQDVEIDVGEGDEPAPMLDPYRFAAGVAPRENHGAWRGRPLQRQLQHSRQQLRQASARPCRSSGRGLRGPAVEWGRTPGGGPVLDATVDESGTLQPSAIEDRA